MTFDAVMTGDKIRRLRESRKWSQHKLAQILGVTGPYIGKLERGETSGSVWIYISIADVFDVSLDYLLTDIHQKTPQKKIRNVICILEEIGYEI